MISRDILTQQLQYTLKEINVPGIGNKFTGKVRDCYTVDNKRILITSDRLSAFDKVLTTIPFKGQILTELAYYWFNQTKDLVPNHLISHPHPNVFITKEVNILPVEVVVRGYLTGSAWRDYQAGNAISGIKLPAGMKRSQQFEKPLLTPSTKAECGQHDLPISCAEIVSSGIVEKQLWQQVEEAALKLFAFGSKHAQERGLILVDTKYEFGFLTDSKGNKQLILADEIHTQDSSRYWMTNSYNARFEAGEDPEMLDKEFVRRWLIERGFMGEGAIPEFPNDFRVDIAVKYIEAFNQITGTQFSSKAGAVEEDIIAAIKNAL